MTLKPFVQRQLRSAMAALALFGAFAAAEAADTYNPSTQQLTLPTLAMGGMTLSNVVISPIILGDVLAYTVGGTASGSEDHYDPGTGQLTIPSITVGSTHYTNVIVSIPDAVSVSIGGASGTDTWNPATSTLSVPLAEYSNPAVATQFFCSNTLSPGAIAGIQGGMPKADLDVYSAMSGQLAIPAVLDLATARVYTNVTIGIARLLSHGACTGATGALSGVAASGDPIVGGTINVICAAGNAIAPTSTDSTGAWHISLSGESLPCAVEVSGGTLDGAANTTTYDSIATVEGTVNVTPLTDLLVANLSGVATSGTWFAGLRTNRSSLGTLTTSAVKTSLNTLAQALPELPSLGATDPTSTTFRPTLGNAVSDMVTALNGAVSYNTAGVTYPSLRGSLAGSPPAALPAGFGTALATTYTNTPSGNNGENGCSYPITQSPSFLAAGRIITQNNPDGTVTLYAFYTFPLLGGANTCSWIIFGNLVGNLTFVPGYIADGGPPVFNPTSPAGTAFIPYGQTGFYNLGDTVGIYISGPPVETNPGDDAAYLEQAYEDDFANNPVTVTPAHSASAN